MCEQESRTPSIHTFLHFHPNKNSISTFVSPMF